VGLLVLSDIAVKFSQLTSFATILVRSYLFASSFMLFHFWCQSE